MTAGLLDSNRIGELLAACGSDAVVYAPVAPEAESAAEGGTDGAVELEIVASPSGPTAALKRLTLEYRTTRQPAKRLFFPQTETLLRYDNAAVTDSIGAIPEGEVIAFGVRPCDAQALVYLDKVFQPGITPCGDPYYARRRERSLIIAYACSAPRSSCFCTAVGGDPAGTRGADVLVTALSGSRLLFQAVSEKGQSFLDRRRAFFTPAAARDSAKADELHEAARGLISPLGTPTGRVERDAVKARMDAGFEDPMWSRLTESCIGCGACTYLCPTCHCFDIADEDHMYKGRRIRTWDSCQYALFTRHASGHNPRPTRKHRLRQRFMHKLSYAVEKSGDIGCVGCGRCVAQCPVGLDIRDVIRAFSATGA